MFLGGVSPMAECRQQTHVAKGMAETLALVSCQSRRTGDRARRQGFVVVHRWIHERGFGFDSVEAVLATTMQCLDAEQFKNAKTWVGTRMGRK